MALQFLQGYDQWPNQVVTNTNLVDQGFQPLEVAMNPQGTPEPSTYTGFNSIQTATARLGGSAMQFNQDNGNNDTARLNLEQSRDTITNRSYRHIGDFKNTLVCGFGVLHTGLAYENAQPLFSFEIDDGINRYVNCRIYVGSNGSLFVTGGYSGTGPAGNNAHWYDQPFVLTSLITTAPVVYNSLLWNYVEARWTNGGSVNYNLQVRVNGIERINLTSASLKNTGTGISTSNVCNIVIPRLVAQWPAPGNVVEYFGGQFAGSSSGVTALATRETPMNYFVDDIYILDDTGTSNNTFLGPQKVGVLVPDGPGSSSQWTPTGGAATNWEAVTGQLSTTQTVTAATGGLLDRYSLGNLPAGSGQLRGIGVALYGATTAGGSAVVETSIAEGANTLTGNVTVPNASFTEQTHYYDTAADGTAWTEAHINATEIGIRSL